MALLRLLSSPSQLHFSTTQFPSSSSSPALFPLHHQSVIPILSSSTVSLHISSLSPLLPIKPPKSYLYISHCSSSTQAPESQQDQEEQSEDEGSRTRILAQNTPWTSTADDLRPLFEKYGTVMDIEVAMYNKTRSRGLVFVTMGSHEEAKAVLENLEAYELEGRPLRLAWAKPKTVKPSSPPPSKPLPVHNVFVANLHFEARSKDLMEFFKANGADVVSAEVIFNNDNPRRSAGYGFVSFNTKVEADAALSSFEGKEFMGRPIRVAHSKRFLREETKKNLQAQELSSELISVGE
ncbi:28 kDa ribonucleoprotein, chloroplastic [Nicotiana tomentosiformis]|uniref:28 kDa ribonucleoprotein, chloroplastic n=1 Tax=Nicotiana tomentosiformis TaxID=4098 RepID=UPI00051CA48C|nr:28 kDa ribonucleoprotein, chloroplastic [Nicotiana tomentosiformis]XP_016477080.1 PREDICTED: 28 kDa ribonucleoprotein, chloroplastic-like [Nicotiana tabacum]